MFVNKMVTDKWQDLDCVESEIINPTLEQINDAVRMLDANTYTMVTLSGSDETHMVIGGGNDNFVVYVNNDDDGIYYTLSKDVEQNRTIYLNIGGQEGDYLSKNVVSLSDVDLVIKDFILNGELCKGMKWDEK